MILTDKKIRELSSQNVLIEPFLESSLQSESYDLSIGDSIVYLKKEEKCINIKNQDEIDSMYISCELTEEGYVINPKEYVLVSIRERINLPDTLTAHIRPRTRYTRMGLLVSNQHCNSTYSGMLQLGLFNATNYAIKIFPGLKIAQIVFEELNEEPSEEKKYKNKKNSVYQNETSFIGGITDIEMKKTVDDVVSLLLKQGD